MTEKILMAVLCLMLLGIVPPAFAETNPSTAKSTQNLQEVYITKNGKKYHKEECPFIHGKNALKVSKKDALDKKLAPCPKCFKEDLPEQSDKK